MNDSLSLSRPLAFFDLETTGLSTGTDRIVEIAVLVLFPDGNTKSFFSRVNPGIPIPPSATAVHGIRDEDVGTAPTMNELAPQLLDLLKGCDLAGFNVRKFDLPLLRNEFARCSMELDMKDRHVIDVQTIFHTKERRDLSAALQLYCGREHAGAHGASADVEATKDIFLAQLQRYTDLPRDIPALERNIHPEAENQVDPDGKLVRDGNEIVINFGKYRGSPLATIAGSDPDYLKWILLQDFSEQVKSAVEEALAR